MPITSYGQQQLIAVRSYISFRGGKNFAVSYGSFSARHLPDYFAIRPTVNQYRMPFLCYSVEIVLVDLALDNVSQHHFFLGNSCGWNCLDSSPEVIVPYVAISSANRKDSIWYKCNPSVKNRHLKLQIIMRYIFCLPPYSGTVYVPKLKSSFLRTNCYCIFEARLKAFPDVSSLYWS